MVLVAAESVVVNYKEIILTGGICLQVILTYVSLKLRKMTFSQKLPEVGKFPSLHILAYLFCFPVKQGREILFVSLQNILCIPNVSLTVHPQPTYTTTTLILSAFPREG